MQSNHDCDNKKIENELIICTCAHLCLFLIYSVGAGPIPSVSEFVHTQTPVSRLGVQERPGGTKR